LTYRAREDRDGDVEAVDQRSYEHGTERECYVEEGEGEGSREGWQADGEGEGWDVEGGKEEAEGLQDVSCLEEPELGVFYEGDVDGAETAGGGDGEAGFDEGDAEGGEDG